MFVLMKSQLSLKIDHVGLKSKSLSQILEKLCVRFRDQIFGLILMKLGQSVCLDEILYMFENALYRVKK